MRLKWFGFEVRRTEEKAIKEEYEEDQEEDFEKVCWQDRV